MKNIFLAIVLISLNFKVAAFQLVTPSEMMDSQDAPLIELLDSRTIDPQAPEIAVIDPQSADRPIRNPFKMEVEFRSNSGALVDFSSFRAFYGSFKIDVTDRLLREAVRTSTGIRLSNISVPVGRHRIVLQIRDQLNKTSEKEIFFRVE
jgi:hypothetical protein